MSFSETLTEEHFQKKLVQRDFQRNSNAFHLNKLAKLSWRLICICIYNEMENAANFLVLLRSNRLGHQSNVTLVRL